MSRCVKLDVHLIHRTCLSEAVLHGSAVALLTFSLAHHWCCAPRLNGMGCCVLLCL